MSPQGRLLLAQKLRENIARAEPRRALYRYYPGHGPLRRELYARHLEFFAAGGKHTPMVTCPEDCDGSGHNERLFLAANRIGKTEGAGGYEVALHLTGRYPDWWTGLRFDRPIDAWVCGKSNEAVRDILQKKLMGPVAWAGRRKTVRGTGMIPGEDIIDGSVSWKRGVADFVDTIKIRHRTGGFSELGFKSYEQGRGAFEGTERDIIWDDEEPPLAIYIEQRIRLMTRNGHLISTFTPNEGMSEVVREFVTPRILDAIIERWRMMSGGDA
jgi:phage terminase large subunit-like protein